MSITYVSAALEDAVGDLPERMSIRLREGLEATCEAIAARARQTTTFKDRTSLLRRSIQESGVVVAGDELQGVVSFAARSKRGYPYGAAQEFGTRNGVREKRFIRDAIDAQNGDLLESAMGAAFRDAGFTVRGG